LNEDGVTNGTATKYVNINISRFKKDDNGKADLAGASGHEGTHVKDDNSEALKLKGLTSFQVDAAVASGKVMIKPITEVNAYRVSSYIAEAMHRNDNVENVSVNGSKIWDKGWKAADEETKRNSGIRGVLESPRGTYKYKFTGGKNDSIDDPKLWQPAKAIFW